MKEFEENRARLNGFDYVLKRISRGVYDVYYNDMIMYESVDKDFDYYNDDTKAIVREVKRLSLLELNHTRKSSIDELDKISLDIGVSEVRLLIDKRINERINLAYRNMGLTKKNFITMAITEKLEREGLL